MFTVDGFIASEERYIDSHLRPLLQSFESFLEESYYCQLYGRMDGIRTRLSSLKRLCPERDDIQRVLDGMAESTRIKS